MIAMTAGPLTPELWTKGSHYMTAMTAETLTPELRTKGSLYDSNDSETSQPRALDQRLPHCINSNDSGTSHPRAPDQRLPEH